MRLRLLLPVVLLVLLVRCEPVGSNAGLVRDLRQPSDHASTLALANGSSGGAGCRLYFTADDSKVSLLDGWTQQQLTL